MEALAANRRAYALDFWGFGESDKRRESYEISDFVALVEQFMERLGIESAPVIGHSMGGTVALNLALDRPRRVESGPRRVSCGGPISECLPQARGLSVDRVSGLEFSIFAALRHQALCPLDRSQLE